MNILWIKMFHQSLLVGWKVQFRKIEIKEQGISHKLRIPRFKVSVIQERKREREREF